MANTLPGAWEIKELGLKKAMKKIGAHFQVPVGIDAEAMKLEEKNVSGMIRNESLKRDLTELLEPLGLQVVVKYEMVLVTPIEIEK